MTVGVGFTAEQVREFVGEYYLRPHGQKGSWLASKGMSYDKSRRWRSAVFEGDVERGLVRREGSPMTVPSAKRTAWERARVAERAAWVAVSRASTRMRSPTTASCSASSSKAAAVETTGPQRGLRWLAATTSGCMWARAAAADAGRLSGLQRGLSGRCCRVDRGNRRRALDLAAGSSVGEAARRTEACAHSVVTRLLPCVEVVDP